MIALIDGDVLTYRSGFAAEKLFYEVKVDGVVIAEFRYKADVVEFLELHDMVLDEVELSTYVVPEPVQNALYSVNNTIDSILHDTGADNYLVYLTGDTNFRNEVAVTHKYKGNRKGRKPTHYAAIREYLLRKHRAIIVEGFEADDLMAINQIQNPDSRCICTNDKDLDMIAGWHYDWTEHRKYFITPQEADWHFYRQLLTGDDIDNIKGIHGMGPATAEKVLSVADAEGKSYICMVGLHYAIHFDDPESRLIENAKLLWILRNEEEQGSIPPLISQIWNTDSIRDP